MDVEKVLEKESNGKKGKNTQKYATRVKWMRERIHRDESKRNEMAKPLANEWKRTRCVPCFPRLCVSAPHNVFCIKMLVKSK